MVTIVSIGDLMMEGKAALQTGPFGTQLKANEYLSTGVPVINVRNIGFGTLKEDKLEFIAPQKAQSLKNHFLKPGDIVFGRKGAVERHLLVSHHQENWIQGSDCLRLRVETSEISPNYLSYYFQTEGHKEWMENHCSFGATMSSLNQEIISRIKIPLPNISIQQAVVQVLSAYDDLIEVNNQRIKLLEETARELYKEWFVRMRFPGYKKTKFVKGIPQGWGIGNVSQIAQINLRTAKLPSSTEIKYVDISSVGSGVIESSSDYQFKDAPGRARRLVHHGDIIFSTVRPENRSFAYVLSPPKNLVVSTGFAVISPADTIFSAFLLNIISSDAFVEEMVNKSKGAAYPQVSFDDIKRFTFLKPTSEVLKAFEGTVHTMYEQVSVLRGMNRCLKDIRDLLLPRLISGKLRLKEPKEAKVVAIKQPSVSMVAEAEMSYKKKAK